MEKTLNEILCMLEQQLAFQKAMMGLLVIILRMEDGRDSERSKEVANLIEKEVGMF
jgi:hypothetical protein